MRIRLLYPLIFLILSGTVEGQLVHPPYRQYTLRDGLPQMQVTCLLQDSRGYIWAGTKGGLTCFNGYKFINFTRGKELLDDYITDLEEDSQGNVWIGTQSGLARYDGKQITSFPSGLSQRLIGMKIAPTPDGRVWYMSWITDRPSVFGTLENAVYTDKKSILSHPPDTEVYRDMAWSEKGNTLLVYFQPHLYEIRDNQARIIHTMQDSMFIIVKQGKEIFFVESSDYENFKVLEYTGSGLKEAAIVRKGKPSGKFLLKKSLRWDDARWNSPVITLDTDSVTYTYLPPEIHKSVILEDRENQLWIGAEEGLFRMMDTGMETWRKEVLPQIWGITEDQQGNIYFASYFSGLYKYDGKKVVSLPDIRYRDNPVDYYFKPARDKRGKLYFPTSRGIVMVDGSSQGLISLNTSLTLFYDQERDMLWDGGRRRADVYDSDLRVVRTIGEKEGMTNERFVVSIAKDRQGWYWLANLAGITRYNWETRQLVNYNRSNGRLPAEGIYSVFTDPLGITWMGSTNGLLRYDPTRDSILLMNLPDITRPVNFVTSIDSVWLVFSQPTGIYLTDLREYYRSGKMNLRFYNEKNGFLGIEPGQDGAFTDSRGNLWMTTSTEVVRLDPRRLRDSFDTLNLRISSCNGELLSYQSAGVTLPRNSLNAILTFDAIAFNRPMPVQFSWRLAGQDKDTLWSAWDEKDYVVLSRLPRKRNTFEVKARVPGLPQAAPARASLILETRIALWRQDWFFPALFSVAAFLTLITGLLLLRTRTRMSQATREAKMFQVKAIQSQMNPHFIFNALASLQSMILTSDLSKANEYLVRLAGLIRGFLESSLATGYRSGNHAAGEVPLREELEIMDNFVSFQQLIHPGKFNYHLTVDPGIDPATFTLPPMLIQPFAENAIRHGLLRKKGEGTLDISITRNEGGGTTIVISDNGIGLEMSHIVDSESPLRYVSRGRELTLNRIRLMNETGYQIQVRTDSSDQGTTITIQFKNHGA